MFIKPAKPDILLRDPRSRVQLNPEGGNVPNTSFWVRRIQDGDAVEVKPADSTKKSSKKTRKAPEKTPEPQAEESAKAKPDTQKDE